MMRSKKNNKKIIMLTGAGFSAPLGYSTLFNFESAIAQYAPRTTAKEKRELVNLFQQIRKTLVAKGEYSDFEAILWKFSNYLDLCTNIRLDHFLEEEFLSTVKDRFRHSAFAQRISQGRKIVDNIILDHYGIYCDKKVEMNSIFKFITKLSEYNDGLIDYYTTNYDIGLESIWKNVTNGFQITNGIANPKEVSGNWNSTLLDVTKPNRKGLYVHRLHGCVKWYKKIQKSSEDSDYEIKALPQSGQCESGWEPCVMYPGRKFNTSEAPFSDAFINFEKSLFETNCCIIIGMSFRDDNIMEYLIKANSSRENPVPIIIIDIANIQNRFFFRVKQVKTSTYFYYPRTEWKIKFIVGEYLKENTLTELFNTLDHLEGINPKNEEKYTA